MAIKNKKHVTAGIAYIMSSFNNTRVTITDLSGNTISWSSGGTVGFKGARKSTPYVAQIVAEDAGRKAFECGMQVLDINIKGPGVGRETAVRALHSLGFKVNSIVDTTSVPHNGCRPPKKRRV